MSKSSQRWLKEHFKDPYVKKSWEEGYRARAAYKLIELQEKYRFLKPNMNVVDLGAAPGSWSQVARRYIGKNGHLIALDILDMDPLPHVHFIEGDFTLDATFDILMSHLEGKDIHGVLSDMAPNMSGSKTADQAQSMCLVEIAYDFAQKVLVKGGHFVTKIFQGRDLDAFIQQAKQEFSAVHFCKPHASRDRSPEHYLVCLGLK
jgi:23S rRNA (uridine2552-2'-O)-methyltransferase